MSQQRLPLEGIIGKRRHAAVLRGQRTQAAEIVRSADGPPPGQEEFWRDSETPLPWPVVRVHAPQDAGRP